MPELPPATKHSWWQLHFVLPLSKLLMRILFLLLGPIRARGGYRVPKQGSLLILANHLADVDPIVVQVACHRAIHFMAKSELFEMPFIGRFIRLFKAFPVKRGEPDRASMKHAIELLRNGEVVAVFPEGQLSETGELQELKPGIALIVRQAGAPVICCGLRNTNLVMPYGKVLPRMSFRNVHVNWGEVREFSKATETEEILDWAKGQLLELTQPD